MACGDNVCDADVGAFAVPAPDTLGGAWLQQHEEVLLTAADLGLVRLRVPKGYTKQRLQLALKQWLGISRCDGVDLQRVPASRAGVPIFCLPRPGASTLTVVLHDICDSLGETVVATVDSPTVGVLPLTHLKQGPLQPFWDDVLLREPSPCVFTCIAAERSSTGFPYSCTRLGLDYARARLLGWRPRLESRVHTADLVSHAGALGIQWDILREVHTAEVATQSTPLHWPVQASPLVSISAPVRRLAQRCVPAEGFYPAGTYYRLECPFMGVQCQVPCLPRYHLWAVRLGDEVLGACTQSITWHDVAQVAGLSAWDLPQTLIHEGVLSWEWPQDLSAMSGHCGQVFYQGDVVDNCWKGNKKFTSGPPSQDQDAVSVSDLDPSFSHAGPSVSAALLMCTFRRPVLLLFAAMHLPQVSIGTRDVPTLPESAPALREVAFGFNATQTCSVAWCHELACQSTHFGVTAEALAAYFRAHSPYEIVRIFLWKPLAGPLAFEVHRDSGPAELERMLQAAGHHLTHGLIIAFDTLTTSVDLLSVPIGPTVWWIIRDGIARELLRPVALWQEARCRYVVTLNSHGQANAVTCSPEVAAMRRLPQGVRGYTSMPLSTIYGHLTHHGLVLAEAAIGSLAAATSFEHGLSAPLRLCVLASVALWLPGVSAMQQQTTPWAPVPSQPRGSPHAWVSVPLQPRCMRVWTHTIEAPVMFDYQPRPNPEYLTRHLAHLGRGVPSVGDFVWTTPTVVQGVAHLLHIPPNCVPPMLFWLLHYRGRAAVVAVPPGNFDWSRVAQLAHDHFGADIFRRNAFSIQHQNYVLPYGTNVPTPPHGSILHLVRSISAPAASFTAWEAVPESIGMLHFDYDICAGPGGEVCLVPDLSADPSGHTMRQAAPDSPTRTETAPTALLSRQVTEVVAQVETLTLRLETAGILPSSEGTVGAAWEDDPAASGGGTSDSWTPVTEPRSGASFSHGQPHSPWLCLLGFAVHRPWLGILFMGVRSVQGDGDDCSSDDSSVPPSSPDLTDLQPPTPVTVPPHGGHGVNDVDSIVRPSDSDLAHTLIPRSESAFVSAPDFDRSLIPVLQRRVAAALSEVNVDMPPRPFLPAGCPIVMHNPFTARGQVQIISTVVETPQAFQEVLQDFAARRGWQPLVCVQPQPDDAAIHLIPSARNHDLVAVLLRTASSVEPRCLARSLPVAQYHSITINGRAGRLRLPYQVRRGGTKLVHLRDGDCVHADVGPWGPPPPEPVHSATFRTCQPALPAFSLFWLLSGRSGLFMLGAHAMLEAASIWEYLQIASFPWRRDPSQATLRQVGGPAPCRCLYLCPWTGRHSSVQSTTDTSIQQLQVTLRHRMVGPPSMQPIWPSLRQNCLAFVPRVIASELACVVGLRAGTVHPLVMPRCITPADLQLVCQHHLGRSVGPVRLPPALKARRLANPTEPLFLRDGDVLDVVDAAHPSVVASVQSELKLKDHVLWSRDFRVDSCVTVRLWFPHVRTPVLTWLQNGEHWDSDMLTFRPHFASRYDGRWVPVVWAPGRTPHLVQASGEANSVATLVDDRDGVQGVRFVSRITGLDLAEALHTSASAVNVLGLAQRPPNEQLHLRDGDVVWDSLLYGEQESWWSLLEDEVSGLCLTGMFAGLARRRVGLFLLLGLSRFPGISAMQRLSSSDRSRSRSPSPCRPGHGLVGGDLTLMLLLPRSQVKVTSTTGCCARFAAGAHTTMSARPLLPMSCHRLSRILRVLGLMVVPSLAPHTLGFRWSPSLPWIGVWPLVSSLRAFILGLSSIPLLPVIMRCRHSANEPWGCPICSCHATRPSGHTHVRQLFVLLCDTATPLMCTPRSPIMTTAPPPEPHSNILVICTTIMPGTKNFGSSTEVELRFGNMMMITSTLASIDGSLTARYGRLS